jgi:hypothetical protein
MLFEASPEPVYLGGSSSCLALECCREMGLVRKASLQGDFRKWLAGFCKLMAGELHSELSNI